MRLPTGPISITAAGTLKKIQKIKELVDSINDGVVIIITAQPDVWSSNVLEQDWNLMVKSNQYWIDLEDLNYLVDNFPKGIYFCKTTELNTYNDDDMRGVYHVFSPSLNLEKVRLIYSFFEKRELGINEIFFPEEHKVYMQKCNEFVNSTELATATAASHGE